MLSSINTLMALPSNYYTFHSFLHSGASLAYQTNVTMKDIQEHCTWAAILYVDVHKTQLASRSKCCMHLSMSLKEPLHDVYISSHCGLPGFLIDSII